MDVRYERCCGLDIHKRVVVACLIVPGRGQGATQRVRSFGTGTRELLAQGEPLAAAAFLRTHGGDGVFNAEEDTAEKVHGTVELLHRRVSMQSGAPPPCQFQDIDDGSI